MQRIVDLDELIGQVAAAKPAVALAASVSRVEAVDSSSLHLRVDRVNSAQCVFARILAGTTEFEFRVRGTYRVERCRAGGWLARPLRTTRSAYWLPCVPRMRSVDGQQHVLTDTERSPEAVSIDQGGVSITVASPDQHLIDLVVWQMPDDVALELSELEPIETQPFFLWGSHTAYARPSDVYQHLIFGHVYENRYSWPKYYKICSENDAHALYVVLHGLAAATGKRIYDLLSKQVVLSVLSRQGDDGGFHHGEWTDGMEAHFRLHCSAMHLMMDSLSVQDAGSTRSSLARAAAFLARQTDSLGSGTWFLHDELERSIDGIRRGPFRWVSSGAFGKSAANMLVLNSHLDAVVALDRYWEMTGDEQYVQLVEQAKAATRAVLSSRPAEWLYRPLFRAIELTFLPTPAAQRLPFLRRALKRVAWKYLVRLIPRLKARFPRLVMPGGYIERELSLDVFAYDYLPINLMDLLRFKRRFPAEPVDDVIIQGLELVYRCRMFERWSEIKGKEYALGFWAEALYHACLLYPEPRYRAWLVEAALLLEARGMGLPPSVLGANAEAVPVAAQMPTPVPDDPQVSVINLSRAGTNEFLLVNHLSHPADTGFLRNAQAAVRWTLGTDGSRAYRTGETIPAKAFLWGRTTRDNVPADQCT